MRRRWFQRLLLLVAAAGIGVAAPASAPLAETPWSADPDARFLLDVQVRDLILGDGVRAYPVPGGTCVILGDLVTALGAPITIDLKAGKAEGWAFREQNVLRIDRKTARVAHAGTSEPLAADVIRDAPEGWCVNTEALSRWFGLKIRPRTDSALLMIESENRLPVELAMQRRERAARLTKASAEVDLASLPKVRLPYLLWRTPSVDVMMDGGLTYSARTGSRVDHRANIIAAGEALRMSYEARVSTDRKGLPSTIRFKAYRSDPDAGLLGPLRATHVGFGDVEGFASPLVGASAPGRGIVITNRPLFQAVAFDRTEFSGELPPGWDAELYRNGELVAFAAAGADGRYRFTDVALQFGDNRFEILTYGPQGQVRSRLETVKVGPQAVPAGETHYWAGIVDPGRDLLNFRDKPDPPPRDAGLRAAMAVEHGLDQRTSLSALVQSLVVDDERLTFVEGAVRRSVGPAVVELAAARDSKGGLAVRGQALAKIGSTSLSWSSFLSRDFAARPQGLSATAEHRLSIDAPLKLGRDLTLPLRGEVRMFEQAGGARTIEADGRTSITLDRFNLATLVRYRSSRPEGGARVDDELEAGLIASGRIGPVRVRGTTEWEISPTSRLRRAELSGYWSRGGSADWEGALAWEGQDRRARARLTHIRRWSALSAAGTIEAASDGSVAAGLNLSFSLDRGPAGWRMSRQSLAGGGNVRAQVFRDTNGNGRREENEQAEAGALLTAGGRLADSPTDRAGWASVAGLDTYKPIAIGVDTTSLSDPNLVPTRTAQLVVPRPGVSAEVLIPLQGGGSVEGVLLKDGGGAFEGLELELVGRDGKVVGKATSDFDGYFLFERVPAGRYALRLSAAAAGHAKAGSVILVQALELREEQPVLRLGSLTVRAGPSSAAMAAVDQDVVSDDLVASP